MSTILTPNNAINTIDVLPNGSVRLGGFAAVFFAEDRVGDRWDPSAFATSIEPFMEGSRPLKVHHGRLRGLEGPVGEVESLEVHASGRGVWATSILPYREPGHELRKVFEGAIKSPRLLQHYSFGGYFARQPLPDGTSSIIGNTITELSLTWNPAAKGGVTQASVIGVGGDPAGYDPEAQEWLRSTRRELGMAW